MTTVSIEQLIFARSCQRLFPQLETSTINLPTVSDLPCNGLTEFDGDAAAIVMGDASDNPIDLVAGYRKLQEG
jgi:hypothetical protein